MRHYTAPEAIYRYIMSIREINGSNCDVKCPNICGPITPEQAAVIDILNDRVKKIKLTHAALHKSMSACYVLVAVMHFIWVSCAMRSKEPVGYIAHSIQITIALMNVTSLTGDTWYHAFTLVMSCALAYLSNWPLVYIVLCAVLNIAGLGIAYYTPQTLQQI